MTMTLISTVTVGAGGAGGIDFTSIPQTYTDLMLVFSSRVSGSGFNNLYVTVNDIATSSYSTRFLDGTGSGVSSSNASPSTALFAGNSPSSSDTGNTFGSLSVYLPNYASTSANKAFSFDSVTENNATAAYQRIGAGLLSSTNAIVKISLATSGSSFVQYSTASLYGITKGSGGATVA